MKHFDHDKYLKAKSKVEKIRQFYSHLLAYIIVNVCIIVVKVSRNISRGETFDEAFFEFGTFALLIFWGIGLTIHAFATFGMDYILGKDWEAKRIQKYIDEENKGTNY